MTRRRAIYLTHPEVNIDTEIATPDWGLSAIGAGRIADLSARVTGLNNCQVFASAERKALESAWPLAARTGRALGIAHEMGEIDRSSTGFLEPNAFWAARDAFFGAPNLSYKGWETANDAQVRIVAAITKAIHQSGAEKLLFAGHGAVGALLYCHLSGQQIDVKWDQPGPGHWFAFDPDSGTVEHQWQPIERLMDL